VHRDCQLQDTTCCWEESEIGTAEETSFDCKSNLSQERESRIVAIIVLSNYVPTGLPLFDAFPSGFTQQCVSSRDDLV